MRHRPCPRRRRFLSPSEPVGEPQHATPPPASTVPADSADRDAGAVPTAPRRGGLLDPIRDALPGGFGGATLIATGAAALLASRRRELLRAAARGARPLPVPDAAADLERTIRTAAADERMARVDLACRAVHDRLARDRGSVRVPAMRVATDGAIEVVLDGTIPDPIAPFVSRTRGWALPAGVPTVDIPAGGRFASFPCPLLVQVGTADDGMEDDGTWFVDLEAVGAFTVEGAATSTRPVLRGLASSVALGAFGAPARLILVGLDPSVGELAEHTDRVLRADTIDGALDLAADLAVPILSALEHAETAPSLRSRSSGEPWEPAAVFVAADRLPAATRREASGLVATPGRGVALITDAVGFPSTWRLAVTAHGWTLDPLGIAIRPVELTREETTALAALLDGGIELACPDDEPTAEPTAGSSDVEDGPNRAGEVGPFPSPEVAVLVRTLGIPRAETADGAEISFGRSKALELVAWLTRHRDAGTRSSARAALWETEVANGTFSNVVSEARRALDGAVRPPEGEEWIARTTGPRLPLHRAIVSDVELIEATAARSTPGARRRSGHARSGPRTRRRRSVPRRHWLWPDPEGHVAHDALVVADLAVELSELCIGDGDVDAALHASAVGLTSVPGHEQLVGLRMRAHASRGDLAAVRREFASYERIVAADPFGTGDAAPQLLRLRHELLAVRSALT
ncbi:MAG: hypothetical protein R2715_24280 [Ilumatobacteraceae bacterium]